MSPRTSNMIAYADCFSGVSGDMLLGALLDAGLELEQLQTELAKLGLGEISIRKSRTKDQSLSGIRVDIKSDTGTNRTWKNIREIISRSSLNDTVKERTASVFTCLAEAEAKIHNCRTDEVHFHEIGALDTIIDIVGVVTGIEILGIKSLVTSPLPMPRGWVHCDHGRLPLPAPAVCEILRDVPVYGVDIDLELVTPTGAALVKILSREFGSMPPMRIDRVGYGAGSRKLPAERPNLLRLITGHELGVEESQDIEVIETNLDDWSPETYPYLCEQLFGLGALDVSMTPIHMKKGRPGFLLQVICDPAKSLAIKQCIFAGTTSIGLRFRREKRMTLPREITTIKTPWGPVQVKRVETGTDIAIYPEYEDCCRVARENGVPLKEVYTAVSRCSPKKKF